MQKWCKRRRTLQKDAKGKASFPDVCPQNCCLHIEILACLPILEGHVTCDSPLFKGNGEGSSHKRELTVDDGYKSHFIICALVIQGGEKQGKDNRMRAVTR